jgi:hypothetical protein
LHAEHIVLKHVVGLRCYNLRKNILNTQKRKKKEPTSQPTNQQTNQTNKQKAKNVDLHAYTFLIDKLKHGNLQITIVFNHAQLFLHFMPQLMLIDFSILILLSQNHANLKNFLNVCRLDLSNSFYFSV